MKAFLVELENKPGEFARIAEGLGEKGINITGATGATCGSSGRVALTTADEAATRATLSQIGCQFQEMDVTETSMRNEPGTLGRALRRLADAGINVEAMIPIGMRGDDISVGFVTSDAAKAREVLSKSASGMG